MLFSFHLLQTILEISKSNPELLELCILKTEIDFEKLLKNKKTNEKKMSCRQAVTCARQERKLVV